MPYEMTSKFLHIISCLLRMRVCRQNALSIENFALQGIGPGIISQYLSGIGYLHDVTLSQVILFEFVVTVKRTFVIDFL